MIRNFVILLIMSVSLLSCTKEDSDLPKDTDQSLKYFYERKENGNLQVYSYDGEQETNLVNDTTHDYWWIKVSPTRQNFCATVRPGMPE